MSSLSSLTLSRLIWMSQQTEKVCLKLIQKMRNLSWGMRTWWISTLPLRTRSEVSSVKSCGSFAGIFVLHFSPLRDTYSSIGLAASWAVVVWSFLQWADLACSMRSDDYMEHGILHPSTFSNPEPIHIPMTHFPNPELLESGAIAILQWF